MDGSVTGTVTRIDRKALETPNLTAGGKPWENWEIDAMMLWMASPREELGLVFVWDMVPGGEFFLGTNIKNQGTDGWK